MEEGGGSEAMGETRAWGNLVREEDFRNKERVYPREREREQERARESLRARVRAREREECLHMKQGSSAMKAHLFFFPPFLSFLLRPLQSFLAAYLPNPRPPRKLAINLFHPNSKPIAGQTFPRHWEVGVGWCRTHNPST